MVCTERSAGVSLTHYQVINSFKVIKLDLSDIVSDSQEHIHVQHIQHMLERTHVY